MGFTRIRRISGYSLVGRPKSISERLAKSRKLKQNALKRAAQKKGKIFDALGEVHGRVKKTKAQFFGLVAEQRQKKARILRKPNLNQRIERATLRVNTEGIKK